MPDVANVDSLSMQQKRFRILMTLAACAFAFVFLALSTWVVRGAEEDQLLRSARTYAKAIDSFRDFYTERIVNPLIGHPWVEVTEHYRDRPGSIPIPATMTLDLADFMSERDANIDTRLISDFPFPQRADRAMSEFEKQALDEMREADLDELYRFEYGLQEKTLFFATPIHMQATCVTCHNNHKDSPKRDWQVGDIRGIQVVTLPASQNLLAQSQRFSYLISFVILAFIIALFALFVMDKRVRKTVKLLYDRNDKLEAASKELKQQQNALDQHAIVSMTDAAGNIIYTNAHFRDISGYDEEELIGQNHRLINSGYHPPAMFKELWKTITSGQVWHGEIKNINKSGHAYWVKATIMPLYNAAGQIDRYISIRTNITQQKQLEQDLKHSNDDLYALTVTLDEARQAAVTANEAKSAFLANMSHEIRTPMTGIIGMTDLTLDTDLNATQRGYLGVVKSSADALLSILNDILDFSKIDAGKLQIAPVETEIKNLLMQCLKPAAVLARRKDIDLIVEVLPGVPDVCLVDPVRVRQVLVNICDNAIKFTAKGFVKVSIRWNAENDTSGELRLTIQDQGIGIPEPQQKHIFDAFAQADDSTTRRFGGTGLGLAITSKLVELMQGSIGVQSEVNQGSVFWIHLPCQGARFKPLAANQKVAEVMILSNQPEHRLTFAAYVQEHGFTCRQFDTSSELIGVIESTDNTARLFIIQHHLGDQPNGLEVIQSLLNHGVAVDQCILVSDLSGQTLAEQLQVLGITRVMTHPPTPAEVLDMLRPEEELKKPVTLWADTPVLNILLVEDNKVNQRLISTLLHKRNHRVTLAENGQEAVELCYQDSFDLILMDMQMPVMGGVEATKSIREYEQSIGRAQVPVFAMTANVLPADKEACLIAGMNGHLGKPVKLTELDAVLEAVMRSTNS